MVGTIIGDVMGSRFERRNIKKKDFKRIGLHPRYGSKTTDDSIMSCAVAQAIMDCNGDYSNLSEIATKRFQEFFQTFGKHITYGRKTQAWLADPNPQPYGGTSDGAAMRVSPCGYAAKTLEEAKDLAYKVTVVSHNSPEGLKAAEAVATTVFLARNGATMTELKENAAKYYSIDFTIDSIRPTYCPTLEDFKVNCEDVLPQAFEAFFESISLEDAIRNAISIGGDSDTLAAIAGGIAGAYHGVPQDLRDEVLTRVEPGLIKIIEKFENQFRL